MVYNFFFKVGITGILSTSDHFVFGHRFRVEDHYLGAYGEVGTIPKALLQGQGGFMSTWVYFHFIHFLGRAKGLWKGEGAQLEIASDS
jgi:hypothetical protein